MKKSLFFAAVATLFALAGCAKQEAPVSLADREIRFTTNTFAFTKATESALEANDEIRIVAGAPISAASKATVGSDSKLTLANKLYWASGQTAQTTFVAMYPDAGNDATAYDYDLTYGGSHNYAYQSTFLAAVKKAAPGETVALAFKHPFSKIVVNVTSELGSDGVASLALKDVYMKANIDLVEETVDLTGKDVETFDAVKISADGAPLQWGAIVMPQTSRPTIVVTTDKGSVYNFVLGADFTFEAGKAYTADITLKNGTSHGGNQGEEAVFSFTVTPWTAAATNPAFGEGSSTISSSYWYVTGCVYDDDATVAAWEKEFPMTFLGGDKWSVTLNYDEAMALNPADRGFKFHKLDGTGEGGSNWGTQLGMYQEPDGTPAASIQEFVNIAYDYDLLPSGNKNIRFEAAGNYTITLEGVKMTVVKN